jgi:tight adherence protein C
MIALLVIAVLLIGVAVAVAGRAIMFPRQRLAANVSGIEQYGFVPQVAQEDIESRVALGNLAKFVGESLGNRLGGLYREPELRQALVSAAMYTVTPRMLFGYQVLGAVAFPAVWIWLSLISNASTVLVVLGAVIAIAFGWMLPLIYVRRRARQRLDAIDYAIPELIDLLVVSVEAGMGFAGSLRLASERMGGPLGAELRLVNNEQQMGLPVSDALENLLLRCPTDVVRAFVRAVVEGQKLGISIGQIMRNLAIEMRKRRRQLAEERAHKAPIKILFPLVFLIFPAMFVVLLGPAMFQIVDTLGHQGH